MPPKRRTPQPARKPETSASHVRFLALCDLCRRSRVFTGPAPVVRDDVTRAGWTCSDDDVPLWDHGETDEPVVWWCPVCSAAMAEAERKRKRVE